MTATSRSAKTFSRSAQLADKEVRRARTPLQRTAARFDQWRRLIARLPQGIGDDLAADMTDYINARIKELRPRR